MEDIYSVFIEGEGFIDTFNLDTMEYTTIPSYEQSDYHTNELDARRVAFAFGGVVLKTM